MNVYLFEKNISPLLIQKNSRELEVIIQECILLAIRESIPTEEIIRAYMDESEEHEEVVTIENIEEAVPQNPVEEGLDNTNTPVAIEETIPETVPSIKNIDNEPVTTKLTFNDMDSMLDSDNNSKSVEAPKTLERLEEISKNRAFQRKLEEEESSDDEERIQIHTNDMIDLSGFDVLDEISGPKPSSDFILDGVEEL
jgi:hypothetical protein